MHFLVEVPAVLGLQDPVPGIRPDEQLARHLHALQSAPVLERVADRYAIVALADAEQDRRLPVRGVVDRALLAPDRVAFPGRSAVGELAAVVEVALAPLRSQINFAGMADDAAEAR